MKTIENVKIAIKKKEKCLKKLLQIDNMNVLMLETSKLCDFDEALSNSLS